MLDGSRHVSLAARSAVLASVRDLSYVPNAAARALVRRRADAVALVVTESDERVFGEPYFAAAVRGIGGRLAEAGFQLVLVMARSGADEGAARTAPSFLTDQHVDGVLLLSLHAEDHGPRCSRHAASPPCAAAARPPAAPAPWSTPKTWARGAVPCSTSWARGAGASPCWPAPRTCPRGVTAGPGRSTPG